MSAEVLTDKKYLPDDSAFRRHLKRRQRRNRLWTSVFLFSIAISMVALTTLLYNVISQAFSYVVIRYEIDPRTLADEPLEELSEEELQNIIVNYYAGRGTRGKQELRTLIFNDLLKVSDGDQQRELATKPVREALNQDQYPAELAEETFGRLDEVGYAAIISTMLSQEDLAQFVITQIVQPVVAKAWRVDQVILARNQVNQEIDKLRIRLQEEENQQAEADGREPRDIFLSDLEFRSWLNKTTLTQPIKLDPEESGFRTAILGSIWMIGLTGLIAFPLGVGAAIYLEEYATNGRFSRVIQTNIDNLAGVPSIVYGILGLALFVRVLEDLTSGRTFGFADSITANGRTIISASFTMSLLILPVIIINAQEAIRAVAPSLRQASFGLGATKWQTIRDHVLPQSMPGIMTGTILSVSRAFGETAPLVVVGSITRITSDPEGPFSRFTVLPLQIFALVSQPNEQFKNVAAAGIIILLLVLLTFNSVAILLRNHFSRKLS